MSSVWETLLPMRGLSAYAEPSGDRQAHRAGQRTAEVFLDRRVLFGRTSGRPVHADWAKLHDPVYWPYDVLAALKGPAEAGRIDDPRCADALDLLERKATAGRRWAADAPHAPGAGEGQGPELVQWGEPERERMNEWVTADVLFVLHRAGRP